MLCLLTSSNYKNNLFQFGSNFLSDVKILKNIISYDWLIDFNGISTYYFKSHSLHIYMYILCIVSKFFAQTYRLSSIPNTNNLHTLVWFQAFPSNANNYMVSSNYVYLIIVICFHTVIWFQVINYNPWSTIMCQVSILNTNNFQLWYWVFLIQIICPHLYD